MQPSKEEALQYKQLAVSWEATSEALLILVVALFAGLSGGAVQCYEYAACTEAQTCTNASRWRMGGLSCSFTNYVTVQADMLYGGGNGTYLELVRSVCAPGERLHINSVTEQTECAPFRAWPDARNLEIMDPKASTEHMRMCGAWIEAGSVINSRTSYWSFYDDSKTNAAVKHAEASLYASTRLSSTDLGKFHTACQHTVLGGTGAIRQAAKEAYAYLVSGLQTITTERRGLEAVGWLASHACDAPAQIGVTVVSGQFQASMSQGTAFPEGHLAEALYAMEASRDLQDAAARGNNAVNAKAMDSPYATVAQLEVLFEGATGRTDHSNIGLLYGVTPELDGFLWLLTEGRFEDASAYLRGLAAHCALALQGSLDRESTGAYEVSAAKPRAKALGRLEGPTTGEDLLHAVSGRQVLNATAATWTQLRAEPVGDPHADCVAMARFLFPDRIDAEHFGLVVSPLLYERLEDITEQLRAAVMVVVTTNPSVSAVFSNPAAVAAKVESTRVRIAGAPRDTWAGITRAFADGQLQSTDGPMKMAVRQAKAVFTDRHSLLFDDANVCSGPPIYPALESNAYIYPGGDCTHTLLGVLRKPFADERYNNASLASRAGYIIAHELGHNSLVDESWNTVPTNTLLSRYTANLYAEGIADIIAALAIIHTGLATAEEVCQHIQQLWCARVPLGYTPSLSATHPGPNDRGDLLCDTLRDQGLL